MEDLRVFIDGKVFQGYMTAESIGDAQRGDLINCKFTSKSENYEIETRLKDAIFLKQIDIDSLQLSDYEMRGTHAKKIDVVKNES